MRGQEDDRGIAFTGEFPVIEPHEGSGDRRRQDGAREPAG